MQPAAILSVHSLLSSALISNNMKTNCAVLCLILLFYVCVVLRLIVLFYVCVVLRLIVLFYV